MTRTRKWKPVVPDMGGIADGEVLAFWKDLDPAQQEFLLRMSADVVVCHGTLRHKFAGITPGREVPDSVRITRHEGVYQVFEYCEQGCGRFIYYNAGRNGRPDRSTKRYGGWESGVEIATGLGISAWQYRLWMEYLSTEAVVGGYELQEKQRRKAEAAAAKQLPTAKFQEAG